MKPLEATISGVGPIAGTYRGVVSISGETVVGGSIFQTTLTTGGKVKVIQCGLRGRRAEYGFCETWRGLVGLAEFPTQSLGQIAQEAPASVAASWIGNTVGARRIHYSRGLVTALAVGAMNVLMAEGEWAGRTVTCRVVPGLGISSTDFAVNDIVLLRWHPDRAPAVAGWWVTGLGEKYFWLSRVPTPANIFVGDLQVYTSAPWTSLDAEITGLTWGRVAERPHNGIVSFQPWAFYQPAFGGTYISAPGPGGPIDAWEMRFAIKESLNGFPDDAWPMQWSFGDGAATLSKADGDIFKVDEWYDDTGQWP